jgi:hypothetical protein
MANDHIHVTLLIENLLDFYLERAILKNKKEKPQRDIRIPLEPSHSILLVNPFHGKLLKVMGKVDGFTELKEKHL